MSRTRSRSRGRKFPLGVPAPGLAGNLVAYFRFEETVQDAQNQGHMFSYSSAHAFPVGIIGDSLAENVTNTLYLGFVIPPPISLSCWVYRAAGTSSLCSFRLRLGGSNRLGFTFNSSEVVALSEPASTGLSDTVTEDAWHHVVLVATAAGTSMYLNGSLVGSSAITMDRHGVDRFVATLSTQDVRMDELAIYSKALSADDVTALYNSGSALDPTA